LTKPRFGINAHRLNNNKDITNYHTDADSSA